MDNLNKLIKENKENSKPEYALNHLTLIKDDDEGTIYKLHFNTLNELEMYLSSDPPVNKKSFAEQKSLTLYKEFAGEDLKTAIRYLHGGYTANLQQFVSLKRTLDSRNITKTVGRKTINSFVGGRPNVPAFIADSPKTMRRTERVTEKRFVTINMNLAYPSSTTDAQILNRGIIVLNLISLLENNGIGVKFTIFEMVRNGNEIFDCNIDLKKAGETLDIQKCYFPLCGKEFLRRLLVRVKESTPFRSNWFRGYGSVMPDDTICKLKGLSDKQIFISSPEELGINGKDLFEDANNFFKAIDLERFVNITII